MPLFILPITSQWKLEVAIATKVHDGVTEIKNIVSIEVNIMNISVKFQLHPP